MFTDLLKATAERAVRTFAQVLGALLVSNGTGLLDTDWLGAFSVAGMAALISVLMSVSANAITGDGPSITSAEVVAPEAHVEPYEHD